MLEAEVLEHVSGANFRHRFIRKLAQVGAMPVEIDLRPCLHIEYFPVRMRLVAANIQAQGPRATARAAGRSHEVFQEREKHQGVESLPMRPIRALATVTPSRTGA